MFNGLRQAARSTAGPLRDPAALEARLLPDCHVALPGALDALEAELRELPRGVDALPHAEHRMHRSPDRLSGDSGRRLVGSTRSEAFPRE